MLGPFATASRLTPIHQVSLAVLSRAACASMSTTTTTTTRDRGDRYGPIKVDTAQCSGSEYWKLSEVHDAVLHDDGRGGPYFRRVSIVPTRPFTFRPITAEQCDECTGYIDLSMID